MFCKTRCFGKFRKLQRKTPLSTSLFNKVAGLQTWNIVKKSLQHSYFKNTYLEEYPWTTASERFYWQILTVFYSIKDYIFLAASRKLSLELFMKGADYSIFCKALYSSYFEKVSLTNFKSTKYIRQSSLKQHLHSSFVYRRSSAVCFYHRHRSLLLS